MSAQPQPRRPVLLTGASGFVGGRLAALLHARGDALLTLGRTPTHLTPSAHFPCDLADTPALPRTLAPLPDVHAVIHLAALPDLAACHAQPALARAVNTHATEALAAFAAHRAVPFLFISTDQVFDGAKPQGLYTEADAPRPLHEYGRSKLAGEHAALATSPSAAPRALVLRLALVYGPSPRGDRSCSERLLAALRAGTSSTLYTDEHRSPVAATDVAHAISLALDQLVLGRPLPHILHLAGPHRLSRFELGLAIARAANLPATGLHPAPQPTNAIPPRPRDVSMSPALASTILGWHPQAVSPATVVGT